MPILPELLSPAGNWDCARAAVANGADAIYFGLPRFNARMRADNFTMEDLPELMTFLHEHGVKGYTAFNILVFSSELEAAAEALRGLERAGVDAVIVPKDRSAPLNMTARKVACGAAETVPFVAVTNLSRTLESLQKRGIWIAGAAGEASQSLYEMDFRQPIAIVMGSEGKGMRRLTREHCDYLMAIPMAGALSSLNVSVATGLCLYEAVRQRRG